MVTRAYALGQLACAAMQFGDLVDYVPGEYLVTAFPLSESLLSTCYVYGSQRFSELRVNHPRHGVGFQYSC